MTLVSLFRTLDIMRRLFFLLLIFILTIAINIGVTTVLAGKINKNNTISFILGEFQSIEDETDVLGESISEDQIRDQRIAYLKKFFRDHNSELYELAPYFVEVADRHDMDYRLLPAIAMQESNLCKKIPVDSYNCWGWGIYGDKVTRFSSYEEAIDTVAKGLKENYIDQGLVTPEQIMAKYTPSSNGSWARSVNFFYGVID